MRNTAQKPAKKRKRSTVAAGQYLGYSLQSTRFLVRLLQAVSGDHICLEVFGDVGVESPDGTTVTEESKSNLVTNPLSDRSVSLWKTLRNWVEAAAAGQLDPVKTYFHLFVAKPTIGDVAASFHEASSIEHAQKALSKAKTLLGWNPNDTTDLSDTLVPHLQVIFSSDQDLVSRIISRLQILQSEGNPLDDLRPLLLNKLVSEDAYDEVVRWAHGWVKERVDRLIGQGHPARVSHKDFHDALLNYVQKHDRLDILRSVAGTPSDVDVKNELALRVYVRQAKIVNLDETDVLAAINDFLKASIDRTAWADEGHISRAGLEKFSDDLSRTWKHKKEKVFLGFSEKDDITKGRLLYHDCMDFTAKLDGLDTPSHITRGSLHALADDRTIGWHPGYPAELDKIDATDNRS